MQSTSTKGGNLVFVTSVEVADREAKTIRRLPEYNPSEELSGELRLTITIDGTFQLHRVDAAINIGELIAMDAYNAGQLTTDGISSHCRQSFRKR